MRAMLVVSVLAVALAAAGCKKETKSAPAAPGPAAKPPAVAPVAAAPEAPPTTPPPAAPEPAGVKEHILLTPKDVKWGDLPPALPPSPTAKFAIVEGDPKVAGQLFAVRIKMPNGYKVPPHFHPADEHVVVLQGTFNMGMGDKLDEKASTALPVGSFAVMPKGHHHFAWAKGETIVQIYGIGAWGLTYVNPDDDPRNQKKTTP